MAIDWRTSADAIAVWHIYGAVSVHVPPGTANTIVVGYMPKPYPHTIQSKAPRITGDSTHGTITFILIHTSNFSAIGKCAV